MLESARMAIDSTYLDYAASTPVDPRVLQAMLPFFNERFGNPSSVHRFGQVAEAALEDSRERIAEAFRCRPSEVIFTSGGTESDNLAVRGAARAERKRRKAGHILTTPVEHPAVLNACRHLADLDDFELELLPVDSYGRVTPDAVRAALRHDTALVSVVYANNEIGSVNPIAEIAAVCRAAEVPFHTDAVQAAAHFPIDVAALGIDLLSIGAHKIYGPKGIGALICRTGVELIPVQRGGSQESDRRAGTVNVPLVVGLAHAVTVSGQRRHEEASRLRTLRDRLIDGVLGIPGATLTGHPDDRLPNHASFVLEGIDGNRLLAALDLAGFACSSGSACKSGNPEPSTVLLAIGIPPDLALGSLRVTLGRPTSDDEVDRFISAAPSIVRALRAHAAALP